MDGGPDEHDPLIPQAKTTRRWWNISKRDIRDIVTLSALWIAYVIVSAAYSILAPFYPQEAAKFGISSVTVGIIMGASPLCVVTLSPIFGYFIPQIGLKFMVISGCFLVGGSFFLLGFTAKMSTCWQFITFSVLLRVTEGIGSAGYITASFTIATILFPAKTGTVVGLLELGSGLGFVIGPPIGGFLYNLGGFFLPFVVTGSVIFVFIPFFMLLLPHMKGDKQYLPLTTVVRLLIDIPFLLLVLCSIFTIASLGFFSPVMSSFLIDQFGLTEVPIGLTFLIGPLFYMISSFMAGRITDILGPRYCIIFGLVLSGISFFFIGPAPFIVNHSYLWLTCVSLGITGVGIGFAIVPIYSDMLHIAKRIDMKTGHGIMNGIVSGLLSSACSMGEFIGPVIGGGLAQTLSFQMAASIFGMLLTAEAMLLLGVTIVDQYLPYHSHSIKTNSALND